jgi:hypothetical protein
VSSGFAGVHSKIPLGDQAKVDFYSILLLVPAHTTIPAQAHRDDRVATVVPVQWQFGYGNH